MAHGGPSMPVGEPLPEPQRVELGYVSGVFGVRGEVRLHLHHPSSTLLRSPRQVHLRGPGGQWHAVRMAVRPGTGKRWLGKIEGVHGREAAAALKGSTLFVHVSELPELSHDEFYVREVIGFPVFVGDAPVGELVAVHQTGPVDLFEVRTKGGPQFVPAQREFVVDLDLPGRRLVLTESALVEVR